MRRTVTAFLVSAFLLVACSGGDDNGSTDDTQSTGSGTEATTAVEDANAPATAASETSPAPVPTVDVEADAAAASAALLTLTDFPSGWSEVPTTDEDVSDELAAARADFKACFGGGSDGLFDLGGARAEAGDFIGPDDEEISNVVAIGEQTVAEDFMDRFGAAGVEECLNERVSKVFEVGYAEDPDAPEDLEIGDVTVGRLNLTPVGDELVAYRVTVPVSTGELSIDIYVDQVAIRVGRGLTGLDFATALSPFPAEDIDRYVALAAERLSAAL